MIFGPIKKILLIILDWLIPKLKINNPMKLTLDIVCHFSISYAGGVFILF